MSASVRTLLLACGLLALGSLLAGEGGVFDRGGKLLARLGKRFDGVGQGLSYSACGISTHAGADQPGPDCAADAPNAVTLGAHVLLWHEDGNGPPTAVTPAIATQVGGSSMVAFSAGYTSNTLGPTDNKGNNWTPFGNPVVYRGYNGEFNVKAYLVLSAHGGAGHRLSIVKNGAPSGEITLPFVEVRQAGVLQSVAQTYPQAAATITSGNVITTGAATLLAFWWGDATGLQHSAIPNNGFSIIENFVSLPPGSAVQAVVASRQVATAGTYNVSWTQSPSEGAVLWLFAFQSADPVYANGFD